MPKKLLYIIDQGSPTQKADLDTVAFRETYYSVLKKKYDMDVSFVVDDSLVIDGDPSKGNLKIEQEGPEWVVNNDATMKAAEDADIICVSFGGIGKRLIDAAKKLKLVVILRSGKENVNVEYCTSKGIKVVNAPGRVSDPVADMTLALMLGLNREIQRLDIHHIEWNAAREKRIPPKQKMLVKDMTIGLVGFGIIGQKVAKRLSGFEPKIVAYDPFVKPEIAKQYGVELVSLDELMEISDIVSIHARLTPETEKMIGKREILLMKPSALFVNTARAGLVDEEALIDALKLHKIRAAALDVFSQEPLPVDSEILKMDNVMATPHLSGGAGDFVAITLEIVFQDIFSFMDKGVTIHACN